MGLLQSHDTECCTIWSLITRHEITRCWCLGFGLMMVLGLVHFLYYVLCRHVEIYNVHYAGDISYYALPIQTLQNCKYTIHGTIKCNCININN